MARRKLFKPLLFSCICILIISFLAGYSINIIRSNKLSKNNITKANDNSEFQTPAKTPAPPNAVALEDTLKSNTKIILEYKNGTVKKLYTPNDMINCTKEDLLVKYKNWEIKKFSQDEIILTEKKIENEKDTYILKEFNGKIGVFIKNDENFNNPQKIININVKQLRQDDQKKLLNGIEIHSDNELAQFIEDFTS